MQITMDVATLTAAERLHVIQFITNYPTQELNMDDVVSQVQPFSFQPPEEDDEEETPPAPEVSFGLALVPAPPAPTNTGVTLDKAGLPWDERIHSSNKAFVADGTWRKRRGVDDAVIAQVEAELKAIMGIPSPLGSLPSVATTQPVVPPPPAPVTAATITAPATVSAPPPPPPAAPAASNPNAYLNLIQLVTDVVTKKQLTKDQIQELIAAVDPSLNLQLLSKRPDLIPQIEAHIRTLAA